MSASVLPPFDGLNPDLAPLVGFAGRAVDQFGPRGAANFCGAVAINLKRACRDHRLTGAVAPSGIATADLDAAADWFIEAAMRLGRVTQ